jgi:hypothetical protein
MRDQQGVILTPSFNILNLYYRELKSVAERILCDQLSPDLVELKETLNVSTKDILTQMYLLAEVSENMLEGKVDPGEGEYLEAAFERVDWNNRFNSPAMIIIDACLSRSVFSTWIIGGAYSFKDSDALGHLKQGKLTEFIKEKSGN